jgi:8-oxo-dGTP pyrophosphatase MutT (NUDIX family)
MKKRGFGVGLWNATGGKFNPEKDTSLRKTAVRETKEEIGVVPNNLKKVALIHFYFPKDSKKVYWNQDVHVYISKEWKGKPKESEEMRPAWFTFDRIPYEKMWSDDSLWLPEVLKGQKVECWFEFDDNNEVVDYKVEKVDGVE